jgi:3' terminal RNA ribose 2'-O-methyltransferase Hen1
MLLTLRTTHRPATDLGFLLAKNPARTQTFQLPFGEALVFYPEAGEAACTAALLLDVDPIALIRRARRSDGFELSQYTNDRPYAASSFLSVAIGRVFSSALAGRSKERQALAETPLPLEATLAPLPARGGSRLLSELFEPLGYTLEVERAPLAEDLPEWGSSPYYRVQLRHTLRLEELLRHLCVLIPVLDDDKHYWVGDDEVEKLLRRGEGWLEAHPLREAIARRYLRHQRYLATEFLRRLEEGPGEMEERVVTGNGRDVEELRLERPLTLATQRYGAVIEALQTLGAHSVADVGCGEGKLLRKLLKQPQFERILGMDVSMHALQRAARRLKLEELSHRAGSRIELFQGALTYRDARLQGLDAICLVEVIEHLDRGRLEALEEAVFGAARPGAIVVTTPNGEYNVLFESLPHGKFRHWDHRFEWSRQEFQTWGDRVARERGYFVRYEGIGPEDPTHGTPTQMGVFHR